MSRQTINVVQSCGVAIAVVSSLVGSIVPGGSPLFHPMAFVGLALGLPLACYGTAMLPAALLFTGSLGAIEALHWRGWPVTVLFSMCLVAVLLTAFRMSKARR